MIFQPEDTVLVVIDIQEKLLNAAFNSLSIKKNIDILTRTADALNIPVFITEQYPKGLGKTINLITNNLHNTNKTVSEKTDFNAFADNNIYKEFKNLNRKQVIICGIETHICVHQSAAELAKNGFQVAVIADASGSRAESEHAYGLENIKENGGCIKTTEMVVFELLKTSKHTKFKEIQSLIK